MNSPQASRRAASRGCGSPLHCLASPRCNSSRIFFSLPSMMTFRVLLLAAMLLIPGALHANPLAYMAGVSPRLVIYLAKGAPNACGQGCDRWIAVEGKVDLAAAARVSRSLRDVKDTQRPIYLHSPGGSVESAF